ncbi:hypothetical protein Tco_1241714 [Tanacetum coccineum]
METAYKTPIGSTPFRIVYGKACHLPIELEHKAHWALKNVNLDLDAAGKHRFLQLNQLDEFRTDAYEHSRAYKERTKRWHDFKIMDKEFQEGEEVLVFNSRLKLFPGKLRTRWYGPYTVSKVYPYGTVEVLGKNGVRFKVNGHRIQKLGGNCRDRLDSISCGNLAESTAVTVDDEASYHEDALDNGTATNKPKQQQQQLTPTTTTISNIKLLILKKEEYDIWAIEMEHYHEYIDNDVWKVIQNGNSRKRISTGKDGIVRVFPPVSAAEIHVVEKERKARTILLMAIPKDHLRRFHGMDDAK